MIRTCIFLKLLLNAIWIFASVETGNDLNTILTFEAGNSQLTLDTKSKLSDLVQAARQVGTIEKVQVSVWSEKPIHWVDRKVPEYKGILANERIKNIQEFLKTSFNVANVVVSNLADTAKRPEGLPEASSESTPPFSTVRNSDRLGEGYHSNIEAQVAKDYGRTAKAVISIKVQPVAKTENRN